MMDESMYDSFLNFMGKWNTTNTADQITSAYARYMDVLINLSIPNEYRLSKEGVLALIRHRNDVTHGRINEMSKHKIFTALQIMATTYCCILDAAHFSQEKMSKRALEGRIEVFNTTYNLMISSVKRIPVFKTMFPERIMISTKPHIIEGDSIKNPIL